MYVYALPSGLNLDQIYPKENQNVQIEKRNLAYELADSFILCNMVWNALVSDLEEYISLGGDIHQEGYSFLLGMCTWD
jgi:hypothetical protein